jgi:hypothetical protein
LHEDPETITQRNLRRLSTIRDCSILTILTIPPPGANAVTTNPDTIEGLASFGGFKGGAIAGLWRLCVGDASGGDPTTLIASELVITRI